MRENPVPTGELSKSGASRRGKPDFCLPGSLKPGRTGPKVDKNGGKCLIFVYLTLRNRVVRN